MNQARIVSDSESENNDAAFQGWKNRGSNGTMVQVSPASDVRRIDPSLAKATAAVLLRATMAVISEDVPLLCWNH